MSGSAECARSFYEALNEQGLGAISETFLDPDVVIVEPPQMPDATTTHGIGAARAGLEKFTSHFDDLVLTIEELIERGDQTFTTIRVVGTGAESGATVDTTRYDVVTWRDSRMLRAELSFDREAALRVWEDGS